MESTQRRCTVAECERHPQPGWTRCDQHVEEWLDRVLSVPTRAWQRAERPKFTEPDELENRVLDGNR